MRRGINRFGGKWQQDKNSENSNANIRNEKINNSNETLNSS